MKTQPKRRIGNALALGTTCVVACVLGCGGDSETAKRSHFEHDHHVIAHWPSGLADISQEIRRRLNSLSPSSPDARQLGEEISDLIEWTPEIAADTDLSEEDWLPLYHESKSLAKDVPSLGADLSSRDRIRVLRFCEMIDNSVPKSVIHRSPSGGVEL